MGLVAKIFGSYSDHQIKKITKTVDKIEALASHYAQMSDDELRNTTEWLKDRLKGGETLDDILPDAYALVREADDRVLGKRPFRVQLMGGIILHQGRIAEMKTGEGKTLVATLPAYLNALEGHGVHIVTVNDYLARRDSEEMGRVYGFLGLSTGLIVQGMSKEDKQQAYAADITYGTNNEICFDYLRDNMEVYKDRMVQRELHFAIVDEVDSILIDEARNPLIISGQGVQSTELYEKADRCVRRMKKLVVKEKDSKETYEDADADYIVDEKANNATLTSRGVKAAEEFFGLENLTDLENTDILHHINEAIQAYGCMHRDQDYVVTKDGVMIVDAFTGRIMPGRRYSNGLHQAIEAKEGVKIRKENNTLATITFQNYFRMYGKLSGMTGTAMTEDEEFRDIYRLDVVEVPTNMPMIRKDYPDRVYKTIEAKYRAIVEQVRACHEKGQPVLVGTVTIDRSEELSRRLTQAGIEHKVLNAKYHEQEAFIIAQAGRYGAVTISTNMAGRGTDIMLGGNAEYMAKDEMQRQGISEELIALCTGMTNTEDPELQNAREIFKNLYRKYQAQVADERLRVVEAGGLFILGTERHESRRIDNQLRGRSGRQGDPGESRFYLSLEDDMIRLFGGERISNLGLLARLPDDTPLDSKLLSNTIEGAQKRRESMNFRRRKYVLAYDDVMNQQRNLIYDQRRMVLNGEDVSGTVKKMMLEVITSAVQSCTAAEEAADWNYDGLKQLLNGILYREGDFDRTPALTASEITDLFCDRAADLFDEQAERFGEEIWQEVERTILLHSVDEAWMQHIDNMDDLKDNIGMQSYAQRDPVTEYRIAGANLFDAMVEDIRNNTVLHVLTCRPRDDTTKRKQVAVPITAGAEGQLPKRKPSDFVRSNKPSLNAPCPCGSGKKYKVCCGAKKAQDDKGKN
ncbi:MAG: preprotein translocase subunit SecA [Clostridia bacterium]|nr:preprotein translocase subunit SecA [Clostridia bacterium]